MDNQKIFKIISDSEPYFAAIYACFTIRMTEPMKLQAVIKDRDALRPFYKTYRNYLSSLLSELGISETVSSSNEYSKDTISDSLILNELMSICHFLRQLCFFITNNPSDTNYLKKDVFLDEISDIVKKINFLDRELL